jgi:hypothetical protein
MENEVADGRILGSGDQGPRQAARTTVREGNEVIKGLLEEATTLVRAMRQLDEGGGHIYVCRA